MNRVWTIRSLSGVAAFAPAPGEVTFYASTREWVIDDGCNEYFGWLSRPKDQLQMLFYADSAVGCPGQTAAEVEALVRSIHGPVTVVATGQRLVLAVAGAEIGMTSTADLAAAQPQWAGYPGPPLDQP